MSGGNETPLLQEGVLMKLPKRLDEYMDYIMIQNSKNSKKGGNTGFIPKPTVPLQNPL